MFLICLSICDSVELNSPTTIFWFMWFLISSNIYLCRWIDHYLLYICWLVSSFLTEFSLKHYLIPLSFLVSSGLVFTLSEYSAVMASFFMFLLHELLLNIFCFQHMHFFLDEMCLFYKVFLWIFLIDQFANLCFWLGIQDYSL